ncbi:hypothetical protein FQN54_003258 [Arachnomyces sp. PD_36]|nr:hypothetical protein FQN54_003258 [Arachnomyces sp. PD_36]
MSTQDGHSIRFTQTSPQNTFRLVELPPELLEEISSDKTKPLYLKSLPPPPPPGQNQPKQWGRSYKEREYVNICTQTKSYRVQHVHTSNSIVLVRPSFGNVGSDATGDEDRSPGFQDTVTGIAKCGSTLELLEVEDAVTSAITFLERGLHVYDHLGGGVDAMDVDGGTTGTGADKRLSKDAILKDVPLSPAECETAWIELCAFVHTDGKKELCWRPSEEAKLDVWKKILEGSVIQGIELDKQFLVKDLWKAVNDEDDGDPPFHRELFEAVVKRLMDKQSLEACKLGKAELKWANLDKEATVHWVAETYLGASAPTTAAAISRGEFVTNWKGHLPEVWRDEAASADFRDGHFEYPDATTICFSKKTLTQKRVEAELANDPTNWHERLR